MAAAGVHTATGGAGPWLIAPAMILALLALIIAGFVSRSRLFRNVDSGWPDV